MSFLVAKVLIIDKNGKIAIVQRSDTHPDYPLHADLPGGEVEAHETPLEAAVRETEEEAGITVHAHHVELLLEQQVNEFTHYVYKTHVDDVEPALTISWEHAKYDWLTPHEILAQDLPDGVDEYYLTALDCIRELVES